MVEVSSTGAAESIKRALEAELRDARDEMQREIVSGVEGPMREYARQLVLELTAQSQSQLEARIQCALVNAQADVNSQNQRQADVTSIEAKVCSDLKKIPARIDQCRPQVLLKVLKGPWKLSCVMHGMKCSVELSVMSKDQCVNMLGNSSWN
ncbi:hypothetical protein PF001_g32083 [Phytophthora fragariae]|uniref:Uncharacterized protein n=1 Tax=Phytophthora fragariae TaxID=53985 RepID=A0A6A4AT56_9STRA|nr:hypothetical protein PF001_g32083 [Phytophthora fragariae]